MSAKPQHVTLVASTVATVTFTNESVDRVEVLNVDGASEVYFTVDGSTPAIAATGSHVLPAAAGAALELDVPDGAGEVVKLISAGAPKVSVRGIG